MKFEELVRKISPKLKAIAKKVNYRFGSFDEDDLYQEALIHLWDKFNSDEIEGKTESYILQGCFFFLKNYIRVAFKKIDSRTFSMDMGPGESQKKESLSMADPENHFSLTVVEVLVDDIVNCLEGREREVFLLSLEELATRQIGERLGISHVMVVKIEKKIREKLAGFKEELTGTGSGLPKR